MSSNSQIFDAVLGLLNTPSYNTIPRTSYPFRVDMVETEQYIKIYAEIAGIAKEDCNIDFYNNEIKISVERKRPYEESPYFGEISYGHMSRVIVLPICVTNKETVVANIKNGVLRIRLDKQVEEANRFNVEINQDDEDSS